MKTKTFSRLFLYSVLAHGLMAVFGVINYYFIGSQPGNIYLKYMLMGLVLVIDAGIFVGMIGTIVTSPNKVTAALATLGVLFGAGLIVASIFIIQGQMEEGFTDIGHMMVFGVIPIPLVIMIFVLPLIGGVMIYRSVKSLLFDLV